MTTQDELQAAREQLNKPVALYADGGLVSANPSKLGGTWAWVQTSYLEQRLLSGSGVVTPEQIGLPAVTNNYTELLAVVEGFESLPDGWEGPVYTDSKVTLCRISARLMKLKGIPQPLVDRLCAQRRRLGCYQPVLLGGHPTKHELYAGRKKSGLMVSHNNVYCDRLCKEAAKRFLKARSREAAAV